MLGRSPRILMSVPAALTLAACLVLAGCNLGATSATPVAKKSVTPRPTGGRDASSSPAASAPVIGPTDLAVVALTGEVKLLSDRGAGIISDNGAGIISNNGGTLISNNGGTVVSNNGAAVVVGSNAEQRGATYRLQAKAAESLLADAVIRFVDATGKPVPGADGAPLTTRTDAQGQYALKAALPPGTVVMKVALWNGGELAALLVHEGKAGASQDVNTASSLGAAYVLERFVKGDQAVLNKLPANEALRLQQELEAARELLATPPAYSPRGLAAAADDLRGKAPPLARALEDIKALLLGQARLGDGRPATEVPLNRPMAVAIDQAGDLMIAEYAMGRVRVVDREGLLTTRVDATRGTIKSNFVRMNDMILAPDGTLYFATMGDRRVHRVRPDGTATVVYEDPVATRYRPFALALGADGTLYVGGGEDAGNGPQVPRLVAIAPDGSSRFLPPLDAAAGVVRGLAVAPDGTLFVLRSSAPGIPTGTLHRLPPNGRAELLADDLLVHDRAKLARAADGTVYVADDAGGRLALFAADGSRRTLAGPAGAAAVTSPGGLAVATDGTIYLSDPGTGLVHRREPDGRWRVLAGVAGDAAADGRAIPLNTPVAVAFDGQGRLLIAENGRHRVVRYADGRTETIAGRAKGFSGDGGPATEASFSGIAGIAARGDEIFILDGTNDRLRRIGPDGVVTTLAGPGSKSGFRIEGSVPASTISMALATAIVVDPAGRPCWSNTGRHQVQRLGAPDRVDLVAGRPIPAGQRGDVASMLADVLTDGEPATSATLRFPLAIAFDAKGDLFVADAGHAQVRKVTGLAANEGRISAAAGGGLAAFASLSGDVTAAGADGKALEVPLITPAGLCFDAAGNMYVGELGTTRTDLMADIFSEGAALDLSGFPPLPARVRKITPDGRATTVAGPGGKFFADPNADDALVMPTALAIAPDGRLVIVDPGANLVRVLPAGTF